MEFFFQLLFFCGVVYWLVSYSFPLLTLFPLFSDSEASEAKDAPETIEQVFSGLAPKLDTSTINAVHSKIWPATPKKQRVEETKSAEEFVKVASERLSQLSNREQLKAFVQALKDEEVDEKYLERFNPFFCEYFS